VSLVLIVAWLALTTGLLVASWATPAERVLGRVPLTWQRLALLAIVVRLVPALLLSLPRSSLVQWDMDSYHIVARLFLSGRDIYASGRYPYLPLQIYSLAAAQWLNSHAGLPFLPLVKAPMILADAGTAALLWQGAARRGLDRATQARVAVLFALNPLSIVVTALHGPRSCCPFCFSRYMGGGSGCCFWPAPRCPSPAASALTAF